MMYAYPLQIHTVIDKKDHSLCPFRPSVRPSQGWAVRPSVRPSQIHAVIDRKDSCLSSVRLSVTNSHGDRQKKDHSRSVRSIRPSIRHKGEDSARNVRPSG